MMNQFTLRLALLAAALGLAGCTTVLLPPNVQPVVAPSASVAQATRRLEEVRAERAAAEAAFAASEQVCYTKFFVNNCLDAAKEKRRSRLAVLRAIEVEAEYFKRKAAVDQRDREVAQAIKDFESGEARMAAQPAPAPRPEPVAPAPKAAIKERISKADEHAAQQRAEAPQRAASAKAFAERKQKSEERQREIAVKKAEKAEKNAAKAAEASKK